MKDEIRVYFLRDDRNYPVRVRCDFAHFDSGVGADLESAMRDFCKKAAIAGADVARGTVCTIATDIPVAVYDCAENLYALGGCEKVREWLVDIEKRKGASVRGHPPPLHETADFRMSVFGEKQT